MLVAITGYAPIVISSTDPTKIGIYPNYLWVYLHHHITGNVIQNFVLIIYFSKHQQLRSNLKQTGLEVIEFVKGIFQK
jgi:hypothetical protein